jgi:beta-glucosidase
MRALPDGFLLGAATSAFQIEGVGPGRGETIWDRFLAERGARDDGRVACDHVTRWREDLDLMAELGLDAYRFSVSWARVLPEGTGRVAPEGLGFYDRLVDGLLERGIRPWLTLYHWDLPQALEDRGGWRTRDSVGWFADYAAVLADALGDRVDVWLTQNEPWVASILGHREGEFAPGATSFREALTVAHHLLLGHGTAARLLADAAPAGRVGVAPDVRPAFPASDRPGDVNAARHFDGFRNRWFLHPILGLGYPEDVAEDYRGRGVFDAAEGDGPGAVVREGDLATIAAPIDVLGVNYYTTLPVDAARREHDAPERPEGVDQPPGYTEMGWAIRPEGLRDLLVDLGGLVASSPVGRAGGPRGPLRLAVTENGASYSDGPGPDGRIRDVRRARYVHDHVAAVLDARDAGAPVDAHLVWSLLDNLEWTQGYAQRFGLVHVDFATGTRTVKDSGRWLARVLAERRLVLPDGAERD